MMRGWRFEVWFTVGLFTGILIASAIVAAVGLQA